MKKNDRKQKTMLVVYSGLVILCIVLGGCSVKGITPDRKETKVLRENQENENNQEMQQRQVESTDEIVLDEKSEYTLGESVISDAPTKENMYNPGIEYVVSKATIYKEWTELKIQKEKFLETAEGYDVSTGMPDLWSLEDYEILICDISMKNINFIDQDILNITQLSLVYVPESGIGIKQVSNPIYFSQSETFSGAAESKYYHFDLGKGESVQAQVAWLIDLKQYKKEELYLALNFDGDEEFRKFIRLNI